MGKQKGRYFITGLLIVLPILITIYLVVSLFSFFDNILGRYISRFTIEYFGYKIPGLGLLLFMILVFVTGFFAANFIGRKLLLFVESLWFKFPVIKKVYPAAKQITRFLFSSSLGSKWQKVVLLEYPRKGVYTLGFATNTADALFQDKVGKELMNVLIPSVPSPFTGFLVMVPKEDIVFLDMAVEDAFKIIVSGGVLNPYDLPGRRIEESEDQS
ncbi:MAG: DUF502 domain-containing protein [Candidatus Omnitrophota bacterium]